MAENFKTTKQILEDAKNVFSAKKELVCYISFPVIKRIFDEYYISIFYSYRNSEEAKKNLINRPVFWEILEMNTGKRIAIYESAKNEFSRAKYGEKYKLFNKKEPLSSSEVDKICAEFDIIRKEFVKRKNLNVIKYANYLNHVKKYYDKSYSRFYDELSINIETKRRRDAVNKYQSEVVKVLGEVIENGLKNYDCAKWNLDETVLRMAAIEKLVASQKREDYIKLCDIEVCYAQNLLRKFEAYEYIYVLYNNETDFPLIGTGTSPISSCDKALLVFTNKEYAEIQKEFYVSNYSYSLSIRRFKGKSMYHYIRERILTDGFGGVVINDGFANILVLDLLMAYPEIYTDFNEAPVVNRNTKISMKLCNQIQGMNIPIEEKAQFSTIAYMNFMDALAYGTYLAPIIISEGKQTEISFKQINRSDGKKGISLYTDTQEIKKAKRDEKDLLLVPSEEIINLIENEGMDFILFNFAESHKDVMISRIDKESVEDLKNKLDEFSYENPAFQDVIRQIDYTSDEKSILFIYECEYMDYDDFGVFVNNILKGPIRILGDIQLKFKNGNHDLKVAPVNFIATYRTKYPSSIQMFGDVGGKFIKLYFVPEEKTFSFCVNRNFYVSKTSMEKLFTDCIVNAMNN